MKEQNAFKNVYDNVRAAELAEKEELLNEEESRDFLGKFLNTELLTWFSVNRASRLLEILAPTIANTIASKMVTCGVRVLKKI